MAKLLGILALVAFVGVLDAIIIGGSSKKNGPTCEKSWLYSPFGACYYFVFDRVNYKTASQKCKQKGGQLAATDTAEKIMYLRGMRIGMKGKEENEMWIGGRRIGSQWMWISNGRITPITYEDWERGSPSNNVGVEDCLKLRGVSKFYGWDDDKCSDRHGYICEKRPTGGNYRPQIGK